MDLSSINSDDVKDILKGLMMGEFDGKVFSSFMKEANTTLQTVTVGIREFLAQTGKSSSKYTDTLTLSKMVEDLMKKVDKAQSKEEEERLWERIEGILDRMQRESRRRQNSIKDFRACSYDSYCSFISSRVSSCNKKSKSAEGSNKRVHKRS